MQQFSEKTITNLVMDGNKKSSTFVVGIEKSQVRCNGMKKKQRKVR